MILTDQIWRVRCDKCYKQADIMWSSKHIAEQDIEYIVNVYEWLIVKGKHYCETCKDES